MDLEKKNLWIFTQNHLATQKGWLHIKQPVLAFNYYRA